MASNPFFEERRRRIELYRWAGHTLPECAARFGMTKEHVYSVLRRVSRYAPPCATEAEFWQREVWERSLRSVEPVAVSDSSCERCGHRAHASSSECWTTCRKCAEARPPDRRAPITEREADALVATLTEDPKTLAVVDIHGLYRVSVARGHVLIEHVTPNSRTLFGADAAMKFALVLHRFSQEARAERLKIEEEADGN